MIPLDESMSKYLQDFVTLCYSRLEKGSQSKDTDYSKIDLYQEIIEELADVSNYAFLEYVKMRNLRDKKERLLTENK